MLKKVLILGLMLALLMSSAAVAEVTNRDMQLSGGVMVSNASDSFFFLPMESGMTRHWGLYAVSSASDGPIKEIKDGYPARLVHADADKVYFFGYTDAERSVHGLYSVEIATGTEEELLLGVKSAFVGDKADEFLFVKDTEPMVLYKYSIADKKETKVKDMSASEKTIYDAGEYGGEIYFITRKGTQEDGYLYHESSGKATNLDAPDPKLVNGLLYEGYRVYAGDSAGTQIYAVKLGNKKATRLGSNYTVSLNNPRYGSNVYAYDGDNNAIVALPLDGSASKSLALEGGVTSYFTLGGTKDELLYLSKDGVYAIKPDVSSMERLFDFTYAMGGLAWSHVLPIGSDAIAVFGYTGETFSSKNNIMPTGMYILDRATGEMKFGYPEWDPNATPGQSTSGTGGEGTEGEDVDPDASKEPQILSGEKPEPPREEGATYFVFSNDD